MITKTDDLRTESLPFTLVAAGAALLSFDKNQKEACLMFEIQIQ